MTDQEIEDLISQYDCWTDTGSIRDLVEAAFQLGRERGFNDAAYDAAPINGRLND